MKRISIIAVITLMLSLGFASWYLERGAKAEAVPAGVALTANYPLNPNDFSSLGASPFTSAGTYTINASKDNATPSLSGPGIVTPILGVFFSPSGGSVARDEIAVFTFDSLIIPTGVTVQGSQTTNSRPIALLSQSTATIDGTINVSASAGGGRTAGTAATPDRAAAAVVVGAPLAATRAAAVGWGSSTAARVFLIQAAATAAAWRTSPADSAVAAIAAEAGRSGADPDATATCP